jgi:hypothetical protein
MIALIPLGAELWILLGLMTIVCPIIVIVAVVVVIAQSKKKKQSPPADQPDDSQ